MEPKIEELLKKSREIVEETKTLYDIGEAETILLLNIITTVSSMGYSIKLTVKLLKAAAHFLEAHDDWADEIKKRLGK